MVSVAVQNVKDMENVVKEPNKNDTNGLSHSNGNDPYKHFVSMAILVLYFIMKCLLFLYAVLLSV